MGSNALVAIDLGCRGAAAGVSLLIAGLLLRDRSDAAARLSAALVVAVAASAVTSAPGFPRPWPYWGLPLLAMSCSGAVLFWLWARATFDDDFELRPWHGALLVAIVGVQLFDVWPTRGMHRGELDRPLSFVYLGLTLLAAAQAIATWQPDLVAGRRRLRAAVLVGAVAYSAAGLVQSLWPVETSGFFAWSLGNALLLWALMSLGAWSLFQAATTPQASAVLPTTDNIPGELGVAAPGEDRPTAVDPDLLRRLQRLMTVERVYRREGVTIGSLSAELGVQEHRLRQLINEGLGHRNFNAFLNSYRIDEVKSALADPAQQQVSVLTIAMDAGFQSLGPFNRAFKANTGVTPTEYRRRTLQTAGRGIAAG
ncbi:AraC family transcriptional regulator [Bradyrhizobium sp. WSM 1704]|nr:AraC family transcriptional regulator [Bradyrhizobium semiaridum]